VAVLKTSLSEEPLDVGRALVDVQAPELGGLALFVGTVRSTPAAAGNQGKSVVGLEYDAHPELAPQRLDAIAKEAANRWDIRRIVLVHRSGACGLGDPTVVVACGAPHRSDALEACRWMIDMIKGTVPIWKREMYADGSSWVGAEESHEGSHRA
jgi:molybdopterin synthase catalytic subunit